MKSNTYTYFLFTFQFLFEQCESHSLCGWIRDAYRRDPNFLDLPRCKDGTAGMVVIQNIIDDGDWDASRMVGDAAVFHLGHSGHDTTTLMYNHRDMASILEGQADE